MSIKEIKDQFELEKNQKIYDSAVLTFHGTEGFDVYNCSLPFTWDGKEYIYGRVEKRDEWARSWARLFEKTGKDEYTLVKDHMIYQLEDPYISVVQGEIVLGGTHVRKRGGAVDTYYGYFYRGKDLKDLVYFTTGPDYMKDIRLVELADGRIGVFSRPRNEEIEKKYGSASVIGFAVISSLEELTNEVIESAEPILGIFDKGEWGGCNQVYLLADGTLGVIGHQCYTQPVEGEKALAVYVNISFEFDPRTFEVKNRKIIGTRSCYPAGPAKVPNLIDCTFTSGIVMRGDGKADLYAGIGDTMEGRITIEYPFCIPLK
ncbi:Protein of unknown function [Anaerocolumna jejuensis DSM 15929]|uniref:DUF1861 family protein n=1 Tax=Anaerocolumna jejuensis DSM 15929 TaxID=1121322 RepID=A0A1M6V0R1_9FIRM|nr:DUF1861 family protein [Anaerocolumna jejuensis]SHK75043.1 Protein of unknown function [Anaerocolumna jejuensis DSM 15929]